MSDTYLSLYGLVILRSSMTALLARANLQMTVDEWMATLTLEYVPRKGPIQLAYGVHHTRLDGRDYIIAPRTLLLKWPWLMPTITLSPIRYMATHVAASKPFLHANQQAIVRHLTSHSFSPDAIARGAGCAYMTLGTGQGKTFVAAGVIAALRMKTLYITKNRLLADQARSDMRLALDQCSIVDFAAPHAANADADVIIIIINSAVKQSRSFFAMFSCIILDEVHAYCSPTFRNIFLKTQTWVVMAMTATPQHRTDSFDQLAHWAYGDPFDANAFNETAESFTKTIDIVYYCGADEYTQTLKHERTGDIFVHYMYDQFSQDDERNALIVRELFKLYQWRGGSSAAPLRHTIYLFADEIRVLERVKERFERECLERWPDWPGEESAMLIGGVSLASVKDRAYVLWSTYGYGSVGVSIPRASAIIAITGRVSGIIQCLGRITRRDSNRLIPRIVVDIVDAKTCLRHQIRKRKCAYESEGWACTHRVVRSETLSSHN